MMKRKTAAAVKQEDLLRFGVRLWPVLEAPHPHDVWKEAPPHEN